MSNYKISRVSAMHYVKMVIRALMFLGATALYIFKRITGKDIFLETSKALPFLLILIWIVYSIEMACRFFPSKLESPVVKSSFPAILSRQSPKNPNCNPRGALLPSRRLGLLSTARSEYSISQISLTRAYSYSSPSLTAFAT